VVAVETGEVPAVEEEEIPDGVDEADIADEPVILDDHYTSSSQVFLNYTFKSPEGWIISEENSGQTLMLSNAERMLSSSGSRATSENIMILVKEASSLDGGPEGLIDEYLNIVDTGSYEPIENFKADMGGTETDVVGYYYESKLVGRDPDVEVPGDREIDLVTYTTEGDHVYLVKYMGSGIDLDSAVETFKGFLSSFTLDSQQAGVMAAEPSGSMNILVLGVDSGMGRDWGRSSARSDINMIVHINLETYGTTIVTIPRDLWVPIPGHNDGKINGAHAMGGPELAVETFEGFTGLDIDNYIVTDFDGFIPLIDFLGGVTIEVNEDLADGFSNCYLSKGVHHLDGQQALALCRNRHRSGDGSTQGGAWAREREAAKVIKALYEQKTTLEKIIALPAFFNFLLRYTWTDLEFMDIMRLLPVLGNIGSNDISLRGVPSYSKMIGKASAVVHYPEETEQLFEEIKGQ
jgi:LCP family protein required for cell wall assembly